MLKSWFTKNFGSVDTRLQDAQPKTVAENDSFITLLLAACEDHKTYEKLEKILSLPDEERKALLRYLVVDMTNKKAPEDFIAAITCLMNTAVAEKAYEVIFQCQRQIKT